jgi:hypothetical protein
LPELASDIQLRAGRLILFRLLDVLGAGDHQVEGAGAAERQMAIQKAAVAASHRTYCGRRRRL